MYWYNFFNGFCLVKIFEEIYKGTTPKQLSKNISQNLKAFTLKKYFAFHTYFHMEKRYTNFGQNGGEI